MQRTQHRWLYGLIAATTALGPACTSGDATGNGAGGDGAQDCRGADCASGDGDGPGGSGDSGPPGGEPLPPPDLDSDPCQYAAPPTPLRRLTSTQYRNALLDLFRTQEDEEPLWALEQEDEDEPVGVFLPPELGIHGFTNDAAAQVPSAALVERYQQNAIAVTSEVVSRFDDFVDCEVDDVSCTRPYLLNLARRAYRRPLEASERERIEVAFESDLERTDPGLALQLGMQAILMSPHFLYVPELGQAEATACAGRTALTPYEVATRLALTLWDTIPDEDLLEVADDGELTSAESVRAQAARMWEDPRAGQGVMAFHNMWLGLDKIGGFERDTVGSIVLSGYNLWTLRQQAERFVRRTIFDEQQGRLSDLLTSRRLDMHPAIAEIYGLEGEWDEDEEEEEEDEDGEERWTIETLPEDERAGVATLAGLLAVQATPTRSSPVKRGVFVLERLLCSPPPPPPPEVDTNVDTAVTEQGGGPITNRQRFAAHTEQEACAGCHIPIDSVGYAFENYNASGAFWREEPYWTGWDFPEDEDELPWLDVDATGTLDGVFIPEDVRGTNYDGATDVMKAFAAAPSVYRCVTEHWLRFAYGRGVEAGSSRQPTLDHFEVESLTHAFYNGGGSIRDLVLDIVSSEGFRTRTEESR